MTAKNRSVSVGTILLHQGITKVYKKGLQLEIEFRRDASSSYNWTVH